MRLKTKNRFAKTNIIVLAVYSCILVNFIFVKNKV
jgi:hypothetical protein